MPRKVQVVTTCMEGFRGESMEANLEYGLALLDLACSMKPDIVCLPENFTTVGIELPMEEKARTVPGPATDACASRAKEHRTYVICPITTKRDGAFRNSAVIIDRNGDIAGIYDKVHPVISTQDFTRAENGITPAEEASVFELDFGRVACQICFDIGYPETWKQLKDKGAEIVFWPSAYEGGFPLRLYAYLHEYYVVSATRTTCARIINPLGEILESTYRGIKVASRLIDLDYIVCHTNYHMEATEELMRTYGPDVSAKLYLEECAIIIESNREDLPLSKLIEDFGLERGATYYARHYPMYDALIAGRDPEPQDTPYKNRPKSLFPR